MSFIRKTAAALSVIAALALPALASAQVPTPTYWCGSYYSTYPCGVMPYNYNYQYQYPYYYNHPYNYSYYNSYQYGYPYESYPYYNTYNYYQYPQYYGYYQPACLNAYGYCY
jgi:hypothetical protein